jgi:hypothetical protein
MTIITVFRHVPPPIIGTCGVIQDRTFEVFEEKLDWLEACGTFVERFDPATDPSEVDRREPVKELLVAEGDRCLPLILGDGQVVSHGTYPSRTQLAHLVSSAGRERQALSAAKA